MRAIEKRFTSPLAINSGQSHAGTRLGKGGQWQAGVNCSRFARRAHRLDRSICAETRCSRSSGTLTQKTTLRVFDAGSATSPPAVDTNIELSPVR
jgi:hypothetical protein